MIRKSTFAALALAAIASAGAAQSPKLDPFDAHCADLIILQSKAVQTELKITDAQRSKMNVFAERHRVRMEELKKEREQKKDVGAKVVDAYSTLKENVLGQLSSTQVRRLREITLQNVGLAALRDSVIADRLGLSKTQREQFEKTYTEGAKKFQETERAAIAPVLKPYEGKTAKTKEEAEKLNQEVQTKLQAVRKKVMPQMEKIRNTYDARLRAILTSSQLNTYNALRGKPFKG